MILYLNEIPPFNFPQGGKDEAVSKACFFYPLPPTLLRRSGYAKAKKGVYKYLIINKYLSGDLEVNNKWRTFDTASRMEVINKK